MAPPGVTVNAISPIANTRMVQAALERARAEGRAGGGGGLTLDSMPGPEDLGPLGAHLVGDGFGWCSGQVLFAGGPEMAVVDQPRLIEVVRTTGAASLAGVLDAVVPRAFVTAETKQASDGGSNPRFAGIFDAPRRPTRALARRRSPAPSSATDPSWPPPLDRRPRGAASITCHRAETAHGFDGTAKSLQAAVDGAGPARRRRGGARRPPAHRRAATRGLGARAGRPPRPSSSTLHDDASWARAVADYADAADRPVRLVTLTDATTPAGRSRAQAAAQLARVAAAGPKNGLPRSPPVSRRPAPPPPRPRPSWPAHLLAHPDSAALAGAELVVGDRWLGLRSHPRPIGTVTYGGPAIPDWLDDSLREIVAPPAHWPEGRRR